MHKNATKYNKTQSKWCINKHEASKIIDTFKTYQEAPGAAMTGGPTGIDCGAGADLERGGGHRVLFIFLSQGLLIPISGHATVPVGKSIVVTGDRKLALLLCNFAFSINTCLDTSIFTKGNMDRRKGVRLLS
jgi:hypothetical protein